MPHSNYCVNCYFVQRNLNICKKLVGDKSNVLLSFCATGFRAAKLKSNSASTKEEKKRFDSGNHSTYIYDVI